MREITEKTTLHFEKSGETISINAYLENVSPKIKTDAVQGFLKIMLESLTAELDLNDSGLE